MNKTSRCNALLLVLLRELPREGVLRNGRVPDVVVLSTSTPKNTASFLRTIPHTAPQGPRPSSSSQVDAMRAAWHSRSNQVADEAKAIADAYRQARMAEYMLRRQKMIELHPGQRIARGN